MSKKKEQAEDLGIVLGSDEDAIWMRTQENLQASIEAMERDLLEFPMKIKMQKEFLKVVEKKLQKLYQN